MDIIGNNDISVANVTNRRIKEQDMIQLKLTPAEKAHLYLLLLNNETEGFCYGNQENWWKQHNKLKEKILELSKKKKGE